MIRRIAEYRIWPGGEGGVLEAVRASVASLRTLIMAGVVFVFAVPAAAAAQRPDTAALAREIPRLMEVGDVPGLAIAVIADGRPVWTGAFGVLGDEAGTPVDDRTIFSAASLSKPVFAYVVLRLAERGELDLDRPLAELIDYPRVTHDPRARAITARLVLSHGTGLPNWGGERLELRFDPGTGFDYSGEGFVYLQRAVEEATGLSLEELARREAFGPLGMARSSYVWRDEFDGNAVYGKGWDARIQHVTRYDAPNAAFSLLTTAGDYARFVAAVLAGNGLAARTVREMLTPVRSAHRPWRPREGDPHVSWALGWGIQAGAAGPAFWHWGDNGRFKAYVVAYPGIGTGMVYFANGDDGLSIAGPIARMIADDDHWALRWLDYERHDDPVRLARKAVEGAALAGGSAAAIAAYERARRDPAARPGVAGAGRVARFLQAHELHDAARHVLAAAVADHPDSAAAHANLGAALLETGAYEDAIAAYHSALALAPDGDAARRIAWIEERIAARDTPVSVPEATLRRYAGDYGPRRVRLRAGTLYYRREGNPEYRLVPLAADLFALDGLETFRVRFAVEEDGGVTGIVGLHIDGSSDETLRASHDRTGAGRVPHVDVLLSDRNPTELCFGCIGHEAVAVPDDLNPEVADSLFLVWGGNWISDPVVY
jgi:CubicO group peptidase (beta-lactamase class C family)